MSENLRIIPCLLFLCLNSLLPAWGRKEASQPEEKVNMQESAAQVEPQSGEPNVPHPVRVSGTVRVVGSSLFSELVVTGQEMEWYITPEEDYLLNDLQHQTVIIEGEETVTVLKFANGHIAGERRTLSNIKIVAIQ